MSSGYPLPQLGREIAARMDKSADFQVSARLLAKEARERVETGEAGDISVGDWFYENVVPKKGVLTDSAILALCDWREQKGALRPVVEKRPHRATGLKPTGRPPNEVRRQAEQETGLAKSTINERIQRHLDPLAPFKALVRALSDAERRDLFSWMLTHVSSDGALVE